MLLWAQPLGVAQNQQVYGLLSSTGSDVLVKARDPPGGSVGAGVTVVGAAAGTIVTCETVPDTAGRACLSGAEVVATDTTSPVAGLYRFRAPVAGALSSRPFFIMLFLCERFRAAVVRIASFGSGLLYVKLIGPGCWTITHYRG